MKIKIIGNYYELKKLKCILKKKKIKKYFNVLLFFFIIKNYRNIYLVI